MEDISLHILDIAENALRAEARRIEIIVTREAGEDLLTVEVADDGKGMDAGTLSRIRDPFFTTKGKKTGLGIPFLAQAAEQAGGELSVLSAPGKGTRVTARFRLSHIDRPALGDLAGTVLTLIAGHPEVDILYEERDGEAVSRLDTVEIKRELEGVPISDPAVLQALRATLASEFILRTRDKS
ncbi:MAG: hypothetical protein A2X56_00855 [Nitrospirae bacterium GWC2_57_13]|jgi:anti-sigma regulatory factor (Ser/Thr protein kinase)|nr:MAG: hypothetical protein A2072_06515 [Nitrospirae bacterium GWC1_57_7]OGW28716.1 MAG: hypothetical protein A2X56_00855 [Nitrospirae bacterium GWC2_57_13]OGW43418.1 MAG: hypothetical protein A2X57_10995 [Nitrospirae bacterium GWD2_57_8]HAR45980.1 ATP-binding protein [Nitrospiraceae bacterium]HAS53229.1 ATP-binding protein [Nitrospiraceae bacterium]